MDNLTTNYYVENYIAVKEFTEKGVIHYHLLVDYPFVDIRRINTAWCNTFPIDIPGSKNAVRLPKNHRSIVKDLHRTVKYLCKYISKSRDVEYDSRCHFISHEICSHPIEIDYEIAEKLINAYKHTQHTYRYCIIIQLKDCLLDYSYIEYFFKNRIDWTAYD